MLGEEELATRVRKSSATTGVAADADDDDTTGTISTAGVGARAPTQMTSLHGTVGGFGMGCGVVCTAALAAACETTSALPCIVGSINISGAIISAAAGACPITGAPGIDPGMLGGKIGSGPLRKSWGAAGSGNDSLAA